MSLFPECVHFMKLMGESAQLKKWEAARLFWLLPLNALVEGGFYQMSTWTEIFLLFLHGRILSQHGSEWWHFIQVDTVTLILKSDESPGHLSSPLSKPYILNHPHTTDTSVIPHGHTNQKRSRHRIVNQWLCFPDFQPSSFFRSRGGEKHKR